MTAQAEPGDTASKLSFFTWTANTESDLAGYNIYHHQPIDSDTKSSQAEFLVNVPDPLAVSFSYLVEGLLEGENIFNMTAYDTSGNESVLSADAVFFYNSYAPVAPVNVIVELLRKTKVTIETWE